MDFSLENVSLTVLVAGFVACAVTIAVAGTLAFADIAYRDGSLYHQFNSQHVFVVALAILVTGTLLLGMLRREASGFAGIGFDSVSILALYAAGVAILLG